MTRDGDGRLPIDLGLSGDAPPPPRRRFRKRYLLVLLIPLFMFTGAVLGMYFQPPALQAFYAFTGLRPGGGSSSPIALAPDIELPPALAETMLPSDVIGLARIMPRGDVSIVAAPFGAGDARIADVYVAIGDRVEKGAALARLDNHTALESAVLLAQANLAVRRANLLQTRATVAASRDEAQATLDQALSTASEAEANLARVNELFARNVATSASLDAARASAEGARLAVARAQATLRRFASGSLDEQPDVEVAARNLEAAEAELRRAKLDRERAMVVAPIAGTILDIHVTPGQRPPADGIMRMGDTARMMAEVEIWQDRVAAISPGQPVELVATALGRSLRGEVESVGLTIGRQGLISGDAAANKDARVVRVLVALDAESSALSERYVNLEVVARIDTAAAARASR